MLRTHRMERDRRMHDTWALLAYIVFTLVVVVVNGQYIRHIDLDLGPVELGACATAAAILATSAIATCILLRHRPAIFLHAVYGLQVAYQLHSLMRESTLAWTILHCTAMTILVFAYILSFKSYIDVVSSIVSRAVDVVRGHVGMLLRYASLACILPLLQVLLLYGGYFDWMGANEGNYFPLILNFVWTGMSLKYATQVFVSSMILSGTADEGSAFKNTVFSLGSVCTAGSLSLVAGLLAFLIKGEETIVKSVEYENVPRVVLAAIILLVLLSLMPVFAFGNSMAFTEVALHGRGYLDSIQSSHEMLECHRGRNISKTWCLKILLFFILFAFSLICHFVLKLLALIYKNEWRESHRYKVVFLCMLPSGIALYIFLLIVSSVVTALNYLFLERPELLPLGDADLSLYLRRICYTK
jgi:hypothetical protein